MMFLFVLDLRTGHIWVPCSNGCKCDLYLFAIGNEAKISLERVGCQCIAHAAVRRHAEYCQSTTVLICNLIGYYSFPLSPSFYMEPYSKWVVSERCCMVIKICCQFVCFFKSVYSPFTIHIILDEILLWFTTDDPFLFPWSWTADNLMHWFYDLFINFFFFLSRWYTIKIILIE